MTRIGPGSWLGYVDLAADALEAGVTRMLQRSSAEEVDRSFPELAPDDLARLLAHRTLPFDARARVVEVALLRGGREPKDDDARLLLLKPADVDRILRVREEKLRYQRLAVEAVVRDPALFEAMSRGGRLLGGEAIHPATRWMEIAAQPGGWLAAEETARWMTALPPEIAGRAWYHLLDAANEAEKGVVRVGGGKLAAGPADIDLDYHPRDTAWRNTVQRVGTRLDRDLEGRAAGAERDAFRRGVELADWMVRSGG